MTRSSAGIVLVRLPVPSGTNVPVPEILLVHPGGPFWRNKDLGHWSIPKGEYGGDEDPKLVALREFEEELGVGCPANRLFAIGQIRQAGGKVVTAWCGVGSIDTGAIVSNTFEMTWPPRSGVTAQFPEVDRAEYFAADEALARILPSQAPLIHAALSALGDAGLL